MITRAPRAPRARIDVVNQSSLVPAAEAKRVMKALQTQIRRDFAPAWGIDADLRYAASARDADPDAWQLVLLDGRSVDDGYHELTRGGHPLGKVFVKVALDDSGGWTTTASHELLELLVDPDMSHGIFVETNAGPRIYEYEVCDPCQDDRHAYEIDGVRVSDFIHPAWFDFFRAGRGTRFDHAGKIRQAYEVIAGGYASYYEVHARRWCERGPGKAGRISVWGGAPEAKLPPAPRRASASRASGTAKTKAPESLHARPGGSRRARRHLPRHAWRPSER